MILNANILLQFRMFVDSTYWKLYILLLIEDIPLCYIIKYIMYVVGSKSFRPDIQKPRQMENAVRDI